MQVGHMPELLELVDKIDILLKRGIDEHEKGDEQKLSDVWIEIFSVLMPIS